MPLPRPDAGSQGPASRPKCCFAGGSRDTGHKEGWRAGPTWHRRGTQRGGGRGAGCLAGRGSRERLGAAGLGWVSCVRGPLARLSRPGGVSRTPRSPDLAAALPFLLLR